MTSNLLGVYSYLLLIVLWLSSMRIGYAQGYMQEVRVNDSVVYLLTFNKDGYLTSSQRTCKNTLQGISVSYQEQYPYLPISITSVKNGEKDGVELSFMGNSMIKIQEAYYKQGVEIQTWKMWHENGQLASSGNYQPAAGDDTLTLKHRNICFDSYYDVEMSCETLKDDEFVLEMGETYRKPRFGQWTEWNVDGSLRRKIWFENDKIVKI